MPEILNLTLPHSIFMVKLESTLISTSFSGSFLMISPKSFESTTIEPLSKTSAVTSASIPVWRSYPVSLILLSEEASIRIPFNRALVLLDETAFWTIEILLMRSSLLHVSFIYSTPVLNNFYAVNYTIYASGIKGVLATLTMLQSLIFGRVQCNISISQ